MTLHGSVHSGIGKQFELWKSIAIHTCQGYVVLVRQASNPRWSARWKACKLFGRIRVTWLTWIVEAVERADKRRILNGSPFPPNRLIVRTYLMQIKWWETELNGVNVDASGKFMCLKLKLHIDEGERGDRQKDFLDDDRTNLLRWTLLNNHN